MPPKKKQKTFVPGQLTLFGALVSKQADQARVERAQIELDDARHVEDAQPIEEIQDVFITAVEESERGVCRDADLTDPSAGSGSGRAGSGSGRSAKGDVESWRVFSLAKRRTKYPWINANASGIFCRICQQYAKKEVSASGSSVFLTQPYCGTQPDVLKRHQSCIQHKECLDAEKELIARESTGRSVEKCIQEQDFITVDGQAMCDVLKCLYFLAKSEIAHTANLKELRYVAMDLGNTTMSRL